MPSPTAADITAELHTAVETSEPTEPEVLRSRLERRHQRLRTIVWVVAAVAFVAGLLFGMTVGRNEGREMVRMTQAVAGAPAACFEAVGQADKAIREGFQVNRQLIDHTSVMDALIAGELTGRQALQHGMLSIERGRVDSRQFSAALKGWRVSRGHCWAAKR